MQTLFENVLAIGLMHAAAALAALGSALVLLVSARKNKGAKVNVAMLMLALGCVLIGVTDATGALADFQLADATRWNDAMGLLGAASLLSGALYWRRLLNALSK